MNGVDRAAARAEIEALLYTYAERIDAGDFDGIGRLFERGRMLAPNGDVLGRGATEVAAIYERSTRRYEGGRPMTQHQTTNVIVHLAEDGRSAESRSRFSVLQALPDFPLQCIIAGEYEDRFARDARAGWHFTERCMKPTLIGDLSRHLRFELART
jgi:hypothetical protein